MGASSTGSTDVEVGVGVDVEGLSRLVSRDVIPGATDVTVSTIRPAASGYSNDTLLFEVSYREDGRPESRWFVARIEPTRPALFPRYDISLQHGVMAALSRHTDVPMPAVYRKYDDPSLFGAPFFLMDRVSGLIAGDDPPFTREGWILELPVAQQADILDRSLHALAQIHAVDWEALGLGPVVGHNAGDDVLRTKLAEFHAFYRWVAGDSRDPLVEDAFAWLHEHLPSDHEELVLNWGDPRVGNMIFSEDLSVAAILDWEMACIASREMDIGWYTFALRYFTEGIGAPMPPGFGSVDEIVSRYEELSGHTVRHHHFYEVVAGVRNAIHTMRIAHLLMAKGLLPEDSDMTTNNGATHILSRLLGKPAPGPVVGQFARG
ncbi:MAG: Acyl-CoA dehydrogenase family er 11 [Solirubrobacterales bacterium]|nr:Acyl-CoA dehydrogenase family er 11 [Solirubrobacterales bacterium]